MQDLPPPPQAIELRVVQEEHWIFDGLAAMYDR